MVKLSIIILCYHGDRWIGPCMNSIDNQSLNSDRYEIVLVDNGGTTPTVDNYKNQANVRIVYLEKNHGFAGGNNLSLKYARGEYILLLNQDTVLHIDCLKNLLIAFEKQPAAGFISANMLMARTTERIDLSGSLPAKTGMYRITRTGFASYELTPVKNSLVPTRFVSGSALGFKKTTLASIDNYLFDTHLKSYAEDLDLSLRASAAALTLYVCSSAVVYHFRDDAFSGSPVSMIRKFTHVSSNRLFVYWKNNSIDGFIKKLPLLLAGIPLKLGRRDNESAVDWIRIAAGVCLMPAVLYWFGIKAVKYTGRYSQ